MIRLSIDVTVVLTAREATGQYDLTQPEPTDEYALIALREALHEKGPTRFLEDYGLADDIDIMLRIE